MVALTLTKDENIDDHVCDGDAYSMGSMYAGRGTTGLGGGGSALLISFSLNAFWGLFLVVNDLLQRDPPPLRPVAPGMKEI